MPSLVAATGIEVNTSAGVPVAQGLVGTLDIIEMKVVTDPNLFRQCHLEEGSKGKSPSLSKRL